MGRQPHVLVVPLPAQGHVMPLMKLAHQIADHGIKVTFVNIEFIHAKLMAAMPEEGKEQVRIVLASIPDGLEPEADRNDTLKLIDSIRRVMLGHLKDLIEKINQAEDDEQITCVIADATIGWALEVGEKMGVKKAAVWPAGTGSLALVRHIPKLIEEGIIDINGTSIKNEVIRLSEEIPAWSSTELAWSCKEDPKTQKGLFDLALTSKQTAQISNWLLSNTFYELESSTCDMIPNILPVGPLLASTDHPRHGSFWLEDSTCLSWLDKQPACSVIYVAFGSTAIFSQLQFEELVLGLELSGRPFLWVVRSNLTNAEYPDGFTVADDHGKIVEWAPQEKVLAHPSTACFLTHCGWNSTMEGLSMGVPFLCWPYFSDQFHNQSNITDMWKVGLRLNPDKNGIISRHEIKAKIENLLSDDGIKANALKLKEMAGMSVKEGGSSFKNFERFIEHLKH